MKFSTIIFPSFWFTFFLFFGGSRSHKNFEGLEKFLDDEVHTNVFPKSNAVGLALTVASGNGTFLYSKGFGFRDVETNDLTTSKNLFAIGSITKSFTAALAVKILSEKFPEFGERVLDMPINTLAPSLNFTLSDRYRTETVSFKDLLGHRTCLASHIDGVSYGVIKDRAELVYRSRYESEVCPFRAFFVYNNILLGVAGELVAKISGDSYENLMRNFLNDLGMMDSRLLTLEEDYENLVTLMQSYYVDEEGTLKKATSNLLKQVSLAAPAGALLSTAEDMAKYIHFHLNGGRSIVGNVQVVPEEAMKWLSKTSILMDNSLGYGLGLELTYVPGQQPIIWHGGYLTPFSSLLTIVPALNFGIFISTNGPGSSTPQQVQSEFHAKILDFVDGQTEGPMRLGLVGKKNFQNFLDLRTSTGFTNNLVTPNKKSKKEGHRAVCSDSDIVGIFGHAVEGEMEFSMDEVNGELKLKYGIWGLGNLQRIEGDCKFAIKFTTDVVQEVYSSMDGGNVVPNTVEFQWSEVNKGWDSLVWEFMQGQFVTFRRDLSIGNLPQIPYEADSCVAENFYD